MNYATGEKVEIGDQVVIENGKTTGIIHAVVETDSDMKEWKVDEPGVLIESKPFGLVFWPISDIDEPVILQRKESTEPGSYMVRPAMQGKVRL